MIVGHVCSCAAEPAPPNQMAHLDAVILVSERELTRYFGLTVDAPDVLMESIVGLPA